MNFEKQKLSKEDLKEMNQAATDLTQRLIYLMYSECEALEKSNVKHIGSAVVLEIWRVSLTDMLATVCFNMEKSECFGTFKARDAIKKSFEDIEGTLQGLQQADKDGTLSQKKLNSGTCDCAECVKERAGRYPIQ